MGVVAKNGKLTGIRVQAVQSPSVGPNPKRPVGITIDTGSAIRTKRAIVSRVVAISRYPTGIGIQPVKAPAPGSYPDLPGLISEYCHHLVIA